MGLRLRPVNAEFYDLFAQAADHLVGGVSLVAEMLSESADKDGVAERMHAAEHAADETTHAIIRKVNSTFVTPFDREDIYALASGLDDVMDEMEEVVDMILLYRAKSLPAELLGQVEVLQQCAELTAAAMPRLRSMQSLEDYWIEINRLENAGDKNHRRIMGTLFSGEYKAHEVLKLKDIAETLEAAVDAFESVANTVEQIALKEG